MNIVPNWTFATGLLVVGICGGAYVDHSIMESRINKLTSAHSEELRVREVQRAKDEVATREKERLLNERAGQIEQEKSNEIQRVRTDADSLVARLRNQAASKPANPGRVPEAASDCKATAGGELPLSSREDIVSLAERADQLRAGLSACYQAYDSVAR